MKQLSSARELVVTASNSKAFIVADDGTLQPLMIGQHIPAGAVVQIADDGELQTEPVAPVHVAQHHRELPTGDGLPTTSAASDIDKLQKSILAGVDPTLNLEATAAGGAAAAATGDAAGSGNGGFIVIDRTSDSTLATAGFDTTDETTTTTTAVSQPADAVGAAVNTAPATSDIELTTNEDQPITGAIVATDGDGDSLSYTLNGSPANGAVILNADGTFTYTPAGDFNGSDRFTVTISDGLGGTTTSTVTIGVTPLNDAPTSADISLTTAEEQAVSGAIVATDVDGDKLSYAMGTAPANGSVALNADGTFTYTPTKDFNGSDSFTVTISDGKGGSTTSTVTIGVTPENDAPTSQNVSLNTAEEQPVMGAIVATDVDGDKLSYAMGTAPANGSVALNADGTFTYTPAKDFNGSDSFTVTISDGKGGSTTSTVTIGVTPENDAPTSADISLTTAEEQAVSGAIVATDLDGDSLSYTMADGPANGAVTLNSNGTFTYTPAKDFNGSDRFTVTISDGLGGTTTSTVTIGVTPLNDAPTSADISLTTAEEQAVSGAIVATDLDGDSLSYTMADGPANGAVTLNSNGTFTYSPAGDFNGSDRFTVTISDRQGGTTTSTVTIGVTPLNDAPTSADISLTTAEEQAVSGAIVATDLDGDSLSYTMADGPANGAVTLNSNGTFTYTPAGDFNGSDRFTVTISDGQGGTTTSTVTIGVTPLNDAPTSADLSLTTAEEQAVSGAIVATDLDGDSLSYTMAAGPANGEVILNSNGTFTYTPAGDFNGSDRFTVTISDGQGGTTTSTVTIGVTPLNDAPTSADLSLTTTEEQAVSGAIVASDLDGDSLSYTVGTAPTNGSVTLNADGTFTYTPATDFHGDDSFTVTVSDGSGGTTTSTVTIGVAPLNDAPTISVTATDFTENHAATGDVAATYVTADEEGSPLTVDFATGSNADGYYALSGGQVVLTAAGAAQVNAGHSLPAIDLVVSDGTASGRDSATPDVALENDAPTISVTATDFTENHAATGDVAATYVTADEEGSPLTVDFATGSNADGYYALSGGQVVLTAAGAAQVNAGHSLPAIDLVVSDGTASGRDSATPDVALENDAPTISVTATDFTENHAATGDVAATYVTADEEGSPLTVDFATGSNADGYYALSGGQVVLTAAGAAQVNAGHSLPAIDLVVSDGTASGRDSATPDVALENDAPTISVTATDFTENHAATGDVAATYVTADEEGSPLTVDFATGSNADGYYALSGGQVVLTAAGAAQVNAGHSLPAIDLVVSDGTASGRDSATPDVALENDAPTISVTATDFTENHAATGDVAATYVTADEEGSPLTVDFATGSNADGYYALSGGQVVLTAAGAAQVNAGHSLPAIDLVVSDGTASGRDSATPDVALENDAPTISVTATDFTENHAATGDVAATYVTADEEGSPLTVDFATGSNADGYYALSGGQVVLTAAGAAQVNAGHSLPAIDLVVSDGTASGRDSATPDVALENDAPTISVTATDFTENHAATGDVAATYVTADEEGSPLTVDFATGSNADGYYALSGGQVVLTAAGAAQVNAGHSLPAIDLVVSDGTASGRDSATPDVALENDAPTISVTATDFTENHAATGDVAATYVTADEEGSPLTVDFATGSNADGYYALSGGQVVLTAAGAAQVNAGHSLPAIDLVVSDGTASGRDSATPDVALENDAPTISVTATDFTENHAATGDVAATYVTADEEGSPLTVDFATGSNADGYYALSGGQVVLTAAGAAQVNAGHSLPAIDLVVSDGTASGRDSATPDVALENDAPTISVTATDFTENHAATGDVAATYVTADEEGSPLTVDFATGSNADGYYALSGGQVVLTAAGAAQVNAGHSLPAIDLVVSDGTASGRDSATPDVALENDAPTISVTATDFTENHAATGDVAATYVTADEEGSLLTVDFATGSNADGYYALSGGQVVLTAAGAAQVNAGHSLPAIDLVVSDGTASGRDSATPDVALENDAPTISVTATDFTENHAATGDVAATYVTADEEGSLLTVDFATGSNADGYYALSGGQVVLTAAGAAQVNAGHSLPAIDLVVSDGTASGRDSATPDVALENDAPTISVTATDFTENHAATGDVAATYVTADEEGSPLTVDFATGSNADGYYALSGGQVVLTAAGAAQVNAGHSLPAIDLVVSDGTASGRDSATPDVALENDAPTISVTATDFTENHAATGDVAATYVTADEEGSPLTVDFATGSNADGYYALSGGQVVLTAAGAAQVNAGHSLPAIDLVVSDGTASGRDSATPDVALENDAPTISVTATDFTENHAATGDVAATYVTADEEGSPLTVDFATGSNADGYYALSGGQVVLTAAGAAQVNAGHSLPAIDLVVSDGTASGRDSATPDVALENDAPTISVTATDFTENHAATGDVAATYVTADEEGSPLTVDFATGSNADGYYALSGGQVVLTAAGAAQVNAGHSLPAIDLVVSDGTASGRDSATPDVALENDAPTISVTATDFTENHAATGDVAATYVTADEEGSPLTVDFATGSNADGYYALSGGQVVLTAAGAAQVNAGHSLPAIDLVVSDGTASGRDSATPDVALENDAPTISVTATDFTENHAATGDVAATYVTADEEGSPLTVDFATGSNADGYYALSGGQVVLTAAGAAQVNAGHSLPAIDLVVSDGTASGRDSATPDVALENDAPTISVTATDFTENHAATGDVAATYVTADEEGSPLTVDFATGSNADGYYALSGGQVVLTAAGAAQVNAGHSLPAIDLVVSDGTASGRDSATPDVALENDAPVAVADSGLTVIEDTPALFMPGQLLGNDKDEDGDTLTIRSVQNATNGTVALDHSGNVVFTPSVNYNGLASFTYTISDGHGGSSTATVNLTVGAVNDAPTSTNDTITIQEDMGNTSNRYTLQVDDFGSFNDQDTGDSLQVIRIDSLPANGTFYLNGVAITSAMVSAPGGVTIKVSDISAKNLKFDPADNSDLDSSFKFSVSDGTNWSNTSYTTQLNITALADLPTLTVVASSLGGHALEPTGGVGGNGLILNYYDNVPGLDYGNPNPKYSNAVSTETVESVLEVTNPTSSTTVTDLGGKRTISVNDAFSAKGLIYLEAGHSYKFSGDQDDTFRLEIGEEVLVNNGFNTHKDYSGAYKVTTSGYYTFEMFAYNGHYIGDFSVKVAVDTGTAVNLSTSNIPLYTGIDAVDNAGLQHGAQTVNGDGGYYEVEYNHGMAETAIALSPISAVLTDLDLSESLALKIGSIPAGAVLSDGIHSFTATTALGSIDISTWNSSFLKLTPPDGFAGQIQLTITATATESSNADHASTTSNLLVTVDATAGETTALLSTYTLVDSDDMGLSGEYYGYNERGNAQTSTESSGTNNSIIRPKDGLVGNLDDLSDVYSVINAKQDVATSSTGSILIGQTNPGKASASATDAVFVATTFDYGGIKNGGALANLGDGNPLLMTPGSAVTSGHLYTFLNDGASRGDASSLVTTSGFGSSTDSIIRMLGSAYFEAGKYDFQISADDGFALYVDGKLVVQHYEKTAGSTETNESLNINLPYIELSEGLHNIEVVYWDQGGSASFDLSYKLDSVKTWTAFNSNNLALFQDGEAPTLGTLDDLVKGTDGHWYIQTGVDYSAGSGSDTITGTDGKDIIYGNSGNDTLAGGGNNDVLDGGLGNDILVGDSGDDVLTGGDGNDTFKWVKGDAASPAVDHVTDFDVAHDVLDISDLLEGYSTGTTDVLKQYLSVGSTSDGSTMIEVHNSTTSSSPVVQTIVLDGMSYSELTGSGSSSASDVLNHLIDSHLLNIDK